MVDLWLKLCYIMLMLMNNRIKKEENFKDKKLNKKDRKKIK